MFAARMATGAALTSQVNVVASPQLLFYLVYTDLLGELNNLFALAKNRVTSEKYQPFPK